MVDVHVVDGAKVASVKVNVAVPDVAVGRAAVKAAAVRVMGIATALSQTKPKKPKQTLKTTTVAMP